MTSSRIMLASLAMTAVACGGPASSLEGSIGESYPLAFDRVEIRRQDDFLLIEYLKDIAGGTNKICKIVVDTRDLNIKGDSNIRGPLFLDVVQVTRVAAQGGDFPAVKSGKIHFDTFQFRANGHIEGDFEVVFETDRTLSGNFDDTSVELVDTT
ncbi:MAG: hypothetical protein AAB426_01445 [Myxococcota bacterium]